MLSTFLNSFQSSLTFILILLTFCDNHVSGYTPVDESKDLIISFTEKQALDKLKAQVINILPEDYMKSDFYLIRWIRMGELDVTKSLNMILQNIKWRQKNNISGIIYEDWSDLNQDYHFTHDGRDKFGRPFGCIDLGDWDLLGAALSGRKPRLQRYLTYVLEIGIHELLQAQRESTTSITRGTILVDGDNGSARNLCPACIATLFQWIREMELYYPKLIREIVIINAPSITELALKALRPAMSKETNEIMHIFNMDKRKWMAYLDSFIDRSERTPKYGGTKRSSY